MAAKPARPCPWPVARRLQLLLDVQRDPELGCPYTRDRICELAWQRCGVRISPSHVSHLIRGTARSITAAHLWALATVFGVPMSYFTDDEAAAVTDLILRQSLDALDVRETAIDLAHCTSAQQQLVRQLVAMLVAGNAAARTHSKPPEDKEAPAAGEADPGRAG